MQPCVTYSYFCQHWIIVTEKLALQVISSHFLPFKEKSLTRDLGMCITKSEGCVPCNLGDVYHVI